MLEEYLRLHYGICTSPTKPCSCLKQEWYGRCPYWESWGCKTYEELKLAQEKYHGRI